MSHHINNQFRQTREKGTVDIYASITFGNTGAPTLVAARSKGVTSVTRSSQGVFVLTLDDAYTGGWRAFGWSFKLAAGSFPAAPNAQIAAESFTSGAPTITIQFANAAGNTATDPANGEEVRVDFTLINSAAY